MTDERMTRVECAVAYGALLLAVGCLMALMYWLGYRHGERVGREGREEINNYEIFRDTVTVERQIAGPAPSARYIERTDTVTLALTETVRDTLWRTDSVRVSLPIERTEYCHLIDTDTVRGEIRASVSGYRASLDTLSYRLDVERTTILQRERKRWGFTVGPSVGAGWNGREFGPYVGIGVTWGYSF